jgi:hypothetical protein
MRGGARSDLGYADGTASEGREEEAGDEVAVACELEERLCCFF